MKKLIKKLFIFVLLPLTFLSSCNYNAKDVDIKQANAEAVAETYDVISDEHELYLLKRLNIIKKYLISFNLLGSDFDYDLVDIDFIRYLEQEGYINLDLDLSFSFIREFNYFLPYLNDHSTYSKFDISKNKLQTNFYNLISDYFDITLICNLVDAKYYGRNISFNDYSGTVFHYLNKRLNSSLFYICIESLVDYISRNITTNEYYVSIFEEFVYNCNNIYKITAKSGDLVAGAMPVLKVSTNHMYKYFLKNNFSYDYIFDLYCRIFDNLDSNDVMTQNYNLILSYLNEYIDFPLDSYSDRQLYYSGSSITFTYPNTNPNYTGNKPNQHKFMDINILNPLWEACRLSRWLHSNRFYGNYWYFEPDDPDTEYVYVDPNYIDIWKAKGISVDDIIAKFTLFDEITCNSRQEGLYEYLNIYNYLKDALECTFTYELDQRESFYLSNDEVEFHLNSGIGYIYKSYEYLPGLTEASFNNVNPIIEFKDPNNTVFKVGISEYKKYLDEDYLISKLLEFFNVIDPDTPFEYYEYLVNTYDFIDNEPYIGLKFETCFQVYEYANNGDESIYFEVEVVADSKPVFNLGNLLESDIDNPLYIEEV